MYRTADTLGALPPRAAAIGFSWSEPLFCGGKEFEGFDLCQIQLLRAAGWIHKVKHTKVCYEGYPSPGAVFHHQQGAAFRRVPDRGNTVEPKTSQRTVPGLVFDGDSRTN